MKEAGQQGKEKRTDEPKPADTPKGKGKNSKKDEAAKLQEEIDRKTKELARCLAELERKKKYPETVVPLLMLWISWRKQRRS